MNLPKYKLCGSYLVWFFILSLYVVSLNPKVYISMTIVLEKGISQKKMQEKLLELEKSLHDKRFEKKKLIIERTFGKVEFDKNKTPLEIQKEMRDEWS